MDKEILEKELDILNKKVSNALSERKKFMDGNMNFFAEFQIGEKVFNVKTRVSGVCSKHYRYHADRNDFYDTSFTVHCEIREPENSNCFDNTSRFGAVHPWVSLSEYENKSEKYLRKLESVASY